MPMNRKLYPDNWESIAIDVKTAANWTCQECGRPCRKPGQKIEDFAEWLETEAIEWFPDLWDTKIDDELGEILVCRMHRFTLTTAHLDHVPANCEPNNLRAWCFPCHARYDLKAMPLKKRLKAERAGQLNLFDRPLEVEYAS